MIGPLSIAVIVACHNRRAKTIACLTSLKHQTADVAIRLFLFDDGSTDGTADAVREIWPDATIASGDGSAFWAGGMRVAFDEALRAGADHYLWLNDDVVLAPDGLVRLVDTATLLRRAGHAIHLIGGAVTDPRSGRTSYGGIVRPSPWWPVWFDRLGPDPVRPRRCDTLNGNVVLFPAATVTACGSIDPVYRHTLADLDYGLRVNALGGWVGLAHGHVGTCDVNHGGTRWLNPRLSLRERWRVVGTPLGLPLGPWLHFVRRHGGPVWPLFVALPYWRLFAPPGLAAVYDRWRHPIRRAEGRHAHVG